MPLSMHKVTPHTLPLMPSHPIPSHALYRPPPLLLLTSSIVRRYILIIPLHQTAPSRHTIDPHPNTDIPPQDYHHTSTHNMASAEVEKPTEPVPAPAVPDYLASPNAVFGDEGVKWRYGRAPDYSKTRKVWEESKHPSSMTLLIHGRGILWQARGFLCDVPRVPKTMWQNDHKISKG